MLIANNKTQVCDLSYDEKSDAYYIDGQIIQTWYCKNTYYGTTLGIYTVRGSHVFNGIVARYACRYLMGDQLPDSPMSTAIEQRLDKIERRVDALDGTVAPKLTMYSTKDLHDELVLRSKNGVEASGIEVVYVRPEDIKIFAISGCATVFVVTD